MSRGICTVFVALATFQGAFAINVEPHSVINVDMTKEASPSVDSFVGERSVRFVGDLTLGVRVPNDIIYTIQQDYRNNHDFVVEAQYRMTIRRPDNRIIHYVSAVNLAGSTAVVCHTSTTLGSNMALLKIRLPAKSNSTVFYTVATH